MYNQIIKKCESLFNEGLSVSSVSVTTTGNRLLVSISINSFVPLGEGGGLPRHKVTIDYKKCPENVSIQGVDRYPNEEFELAGNEEQAEALICELARIGEAKDVAKFDDRWLTKPNKWFRARGANR